MVRKLYHSMHCQLWISTDSENRIMGLCAAPNKGPDWLGWHLSIGLHRALLQMIGFVVLNISQATRTPPLVNILLFGVVFYDLFLCC
jgi:hypothetical protein